MLKVSSSREESTWLFYYISIFFVNNSSISYSLWYVCSLLILYSFYVSLSIYFFYFFIQNKLQSQNNQPTVSRYHQVQSGCCHIQLCQPTNNYLLNVKHNIVGNALWIFPKSVGKGIRSFNFFLSTYIRKNHENTTIEMHLKEIIVAIDNLKQEICIHSFRILLLQVIFVSEITLPSEAKYDKNMKQVKTQIQHSVFKV